MPVVLALVSGMQPSMRWQLFALMLELGFRATKLFVPQSRPELVRRSRLIEQLHEGPRSGRKLTLISAPAGFGKTTLVSEWVGNLRLAAANESQCARS
jgi:ATP/maltotriose-dependent transcriptional regulator MalT